MTVKYHEGLPIAFHGRENFGPWLVERGLTGRMVEVGVHRGEFAARLLARWPGQYYGVDIWQNGWDPKQPTSHGDRNADRDAALAAIRPYANRATLLNVSSSFATSIVTLDESGDSQDLLFDLDFVYIDADHRYESVRLDLRLWWPKLRPGGVLAGHDIVTLNERGGGSGPGVRRAVQEFAAEVGVKVWLVKDKGHWSYFMEKPT